MSEQRAEYNAGQDVQAGDTATETTSAAPSDAIPHVGTSQQQQHIEGGESTAARLNAETAQAQGRPPASLLAEPDGADLLSGAADPPPDSRGTMAVAAVSPSLSADQMARLRDTLVSANPDAVPEMIAGADFDSLLASVEGAKSAFARIKGAVQGESAAGVPRGGGTRTVDPATYAALSPAAKIAVGIELAGRGS